jgi:TetR/AcrR family tetracycline transcriptional repressor
MVKRNEAVREKLHRETIVAGALALADAEGLDAVTIRRVAQDNGVTPMALYWHFKDKDQLLDGLAERLFADVVLPEPAKGPWYEKLRQALAAFLAAVRPHPGVAALAASRILVSEAGLTVADHVLGLLRGARFSEEQAAEVGGYLLFSTITLVTAEPGPGHELGKEAHEEAVRVKKAALSALSASRFPNVSASADALANCANEDSYYARGLDLLVQGTRGIQPKA